VLNPGGTFYTDTNPDVAKMSDINTYMVVWQHGDHCRRLQEVPQALTPSFESGSSLFLIYFAYIMS
jgi:hypothetical protein